MPPVGTWIEMNGSRVLSLVSLVVPLAGTWIEITEDIPDKKDTTSCPSWARGLKYVIFSGINFYKVVPLVGTWKNFPLRSV